MELIKIVQNRIKESSNTIFNYLWSLYDLYVAMMDKFSLKPLNMGNGVIYKLCPTAMSKLVAFNKLRYLSKFCQSCTAPTPLLQRTPSSEKLALQVPQPSILWDFYYGLQSGRGQLTP